MSIEGYYYLHSTSKDLIFKTYLDNEQVAEFRESPFVEMFWSLNTAERSNAWEILVCAKALGAKEERIKELAEKWKCNNEDAKNFAQYAEFILEVDGDAYCAKREDFINLQESQAGFGYTALEAIADLIKNLGYKAQKIWGGTVYDLFKSKAKERGE